MIETAGKLYIVATPIGHLDDITLRAIAVLKSVDKIAVEDTRHSQRLLQHLAIQKPTVALHEHNERSKAEVLLDEIQKGVSLAFISDAGTPLISDPGYHLVRLAHEKGITVVPIPGPSAVMAALSVSGLPTDRFLFVGFLSAKSSARLKQLEALNKETSTLVFFEAPHRILDTLNAMATVLGQHRKAVLARELTKTFETLKTGTLESVLAFVNEDALQQRGEIVLLVEGALPSPNAETVSIEVETLLKLLLSELSVKEAVHWAVKITGLRKKVLYEKALAYARE